MIHIKKLYEFLKLENYEESLFKNEKELKELLLKDSDFANGEVHQGIMNIIHDFWSDKMNYCDIVHFISKKFGNLPLLALLLGKYNYQVSNGGHFQYYDNGFVSCKSKSYGQRTEDTDIHDYFVDLFIELKMDEILPNGKKAINIIKSFDVNLEDEIEQCYHCKGDGTENCYNCKGNGVIDCGECNGNGEIDDEICSNCGGDGTVQCDDCGGDGTVECDACDGKGEYETGNMNPDTSYWEKLDSRWYEIDENIMSEFENYLKKQSLDGETIENLITIAKSTQKFNL